MKQVLNRTIKAGSKETNEPRLLGSIMDEMLHSNEPLAKGFRQYIASRENGEDDALAVPTFLFRDLHPDTHLGIDLKILSRKPGRMRVGEYINCLLTRDGEDHFTAVEDALKKRVAERRNPIIFKGMRINVHSRADGTLYPTFNRPHYTKRFTFSDFCRKAAEELMAVAEAFERKWK